jgi:hypothetical protein
MSILGLGLPSVIYTIGKNSGIMGASIAPLHKPFQVPAWKIVTTNNKQQPTNPPFKGGQQTTNNKQQITNNKQQTTNNKQQTTTNNQQTTNNKQQTTNNPPVCPGGFEASLGMTDAKII